ncbi:MAG: mandelate racemase/muconate lactonizing enzyme family protein, partial [Pseudomonadota bacterium]
MKITAISVYKIELPLKQSYRLSAGRLLVESLDSTFVRIETNQGLSGWGEGCPWGASYLPAHGAGIRAALEVLAPSLIGCDPCALDHVNRIMDQVLPGHLYAKAPLDIACWDILGQACKMPLWRLLGSQQAEAVAVNSSIATDTNDAMIAAIKKAGEQGYKVHSAKIGGDDASIDISRIETIAAALPQGHRVTFDVNRAWLPATALQVLSSVSFGGWIEQPCQNLDECALVASRVCQPIMLDESLHTMHDHMAAWRLGAAAGIKVKPNRLGGLTRARQVRDFAIQAGWPMHIEDVGGSALADTAAIHLASST